MLAGFLPALMDAVAEATGLRLRPADDPDRLDALERGARHLAAQARRGLMNTMPDFRYIVRPPRRSGARIWATDAARRFVAGGTDLLLNLRRGLSEPPT